ncbi:putative prpol [Panicum miliaceum]|uniref:Prpol n=1 Tax=Panicum miliaceum TaxID=4540 RepID=A0A3L6RS39_PANMI|nr:putative prpol [Panicum miliaceum]
MAFFINVIGADGKSAPLYFGSPVLSAPICAGPWSPPSVAHFQTFHFGSLDFVADHLGTLHLRENVIAPAVSEGASFIVNPLAELDPEALAQRIKLLLGANPSASDVDMVMYSLSNVARQLSGGAPLPPPTSPRAASPFGLPNVAATCARGLGRTMPSLPLVTSFMGMIWCSPASFLELFPDGDDALSDASSVGDVSMRGCTMWPRCAMVDLPGENLYVESSEHTHTTQCNALPDIVDADVVGAFISGTTFKSLVHKLGCHKPRTTRELLDIATNHASGEEAIGAIFIGTQPTGKAKAKEPDETPASSKQGNKKRGNRRRPNPNLVAAVDRPAKRKGGNEHFEQLLEKPCTNHGYPVKHKLKDCELLRCVLNPAGKREGGDRDKKAAKELEDYDKP